MQTGSWVCCWQGYRHKTTLTKDTPWKHVCAAEKQRKEERLIQLFKAFSQIRQKMSASLANVYHAVFECHWIIILEAENQAVYQTD